MARSKWISFAAQHALNKDAQKTAQAPDTPKPPPVPADVKKFGLENFGNTCYANSVLQALYFCTPFRDLMLQATDSSVKQSFPAIPIASSLYASANKSQARRQSERKASTSGIPTEPMAGPSSQASAAPIPPSPPTLFSALRSLFMNISTQPGDKGTVAPKAFIDKLKELNDIFRSTMHQDAHEFLNYLLNRIVEEMEEERKHSRSSIQGEDLTGSIATLASKTPPTVASSTSGTNARDATMVHRLFEGILTSETRCLTCETVSSRDESFLDLSIDIEQNSSVTACLRQFSASEMLCNRNKFFCDSCCDLQEAEKRMKIKKLPNVLALHLKRFKYQEDVGRYIKLTYRVAFPMDLRLFNTVDDMEDADRLYNLFAIVVHIGNGPHHGHYISIIKNGGTWLVFDDDNVYSIPESDIPKYFGDSNSGSAYVLYYQADDIDLVSLGVQPPEPPTSLPPVSKAVPVEIPNIQPFAVQPSIVLPEHTAGHPPGLETIDPISERPDPLPRPALFPSPLIPNEKTARISLISVPDPDGPSPSHVQPTLPSPSSTRFGAKLMNTIRRAPSASLAKPHLSTNASTTADSRKFRSERSPRLSASTPSLVVKDDTSPQNPPPPVPPLPPHIVTTVPTLVHIEGEDKEKSKKESTRSSGGWFTKRKSLRVSEKPKEKEAKGPVTETTKILPPSPNRRNDDPPNPSASNWFRGFGSSQKDSQTSENGRSRDTLPDGSQPDHLVPRNGRSSTGGLTPYDDLPSTPGSATSSLNSAIALNPNSSLHPSTRASTSSSSVSVPRKLPAKSDGRSSYEPLKSKASRSSSPSRRRPIPPSMKPGDFDRSLPPLPHTPSTATDNLPSENGHSYVSEPDSFINGFHGESSIQNHFYGHPPTSFPDDMNPSHQRSTTLPPTSLASSTGANMSSGSNSSTSGLRKATRKLSLTAPMLGFGRNKDKK